MVPDKIKQNGISAVLIISALVAGNYLAPEDAPIHSADVPSNTRVKDAMVNRTYDLVTEQGETILSMDPEEVSTIQSLLIERPEWFTLKDLDLLGSNQFIWASWVYASSAIYENFITTQDIYTFSTWMDGEDLSEGGTITSNPSETEDKTVETLVLSEIDPPVVMIDPDEVNLPIRITKEGFNGLIEIYKASAKYAEFADTMGDPKNHTTENIKVFRDITNEVKDAVKSYQETNYPKERVE